MCSLMDAKANLDLLVKSTSQDKYIWEGEQQQKTMFSSTSV